MKFSQPKVSFIVTSYNYDLFILKTLKSIQNQTFKSFEIIVVDDFSKDKSIQVIENFVNKNPQLKIKLIKHDKNYGQMKALQTGLKNSLGEFICFIDSDDMLIESYAEDLIEIIEKTEVAFVSSQLILINENDVVIKNVSKKPSKTKYKLLNTTNAPFGGWHWFAMPSAMFRKKFIEIILNYKNYDDWKICPDKFLFNFTNLVGNSAILYKPLVKKRCHKNNAGLKNRKMLNIKNNLKIRPKTLNFILKNKKYFIEEYGKLNTLRFILKIHLSYFYIINQALHYVKKSLNPKI